MGECFCRDKVKFNVSQAPTNKKIGGVPNGTDLGKKRRGISCNLALRNEKQQNPMKSERYPTERRSVEIKAKIVINVESSNLMTVLKAFLLCLKPLLDLFLK